MIAIKPEAGRGYPLLRIPQLQQAEPSTQSPPQVLLLEDSIGLQMLIQLGLGLTGGISVMAVRPGQDWQCLIQASAADLILIDVSSCGNKVLEALQEIPAAQSIPMIGLVERDRTYDQLQAQKHGLSAIVAKPFDFQTLVTIITETVSQHGSDDKPS